MNYKYLTTEAPEEFPSTGTVAPPVLFNPQKLKFNLIAQPSLDELRHTIEQYGHLRLEARWHELMRTPTQSGRAKGRSRDLIRFFQRGSSSLLWVAKNPVWQAFDVTSLQGLYDRLAGQSIEQQQMLVLPLKPKSIPEMLALYRNGQNEEMCGYTYLMSVLESSVSATEFFGTLVDTVFHELVEADYTVGSPKIGWNQGRIFEFLGIAVQRQWLLFPFVYHSSGIKEHYILSHFINVDRFFNDSYRPHEIDPLLDALRQIPAPKTTHKNIVQHLRNLVICSTYRRIEQSSCALFERCLSLIGETERPMSIQQVGMARRTYNSIIKLYNSQVGGVPKLKQVSPPQKAVSVNEFASFQHLRDLDEKWNAWADAFEQFIRATKDTQGQVRKTACREFADFLTTVEKAPLRPELTLRLHVNDFGGTGNTYRNYLQQKFESPASRNIKLNLLAQFFEDVREKLRAEHQGPPQDTPWFPNPIDMKFDRFEEPYRAGTTRKAIASEVMEVMRNILTEDDYAWPKAINGKYDWIHLVNHDTGKLEYVWCPIATLLLYTLLSVPLLSLQARLLDSGEGDAEIYDFDRGCMVPNPNQLPVEGARDARRREGVLQVMASGMLGVTDIVGLWISTNKTSDTGYAIPWVSDELLRHLRYQRDWIMRYAHHPNMHGVSAAQGHRNTPAEWQAREPKFYCLFRDPAAERLADPTLPVSKQKLLRLWGALCLETQQRINAMAKNQSERITLTTPGTEDNRYPTAIYDIHTLRVSGITDLLDRGVPLNIVCEYVAGHATYIMTLWYDKPSPGMVREQLLKARKAVGDSTGPLPHFTQDELEELKPFLVSHPNYKDMYTGFDALEENKGLVLFRQSGICPGACCDEGGLNEQKRPMPVPVGDRGPSCPQCRFWLTGPAFLLGQAIEGNQLILKIRNKIRSLAAIRDKIMDAEDVANLKQADLLRGQADIEERQLNDMLTEWWHRMRFYEASVRKLDDYRDAQRKKDATEADADGQRIVLLSKATEEDIRYSFSNATELELKHFLSTCAEVLPEFSAEDTGARQDIELAVGKFLAINDENDLTAIFFKLGDQQRLTAANLTVELMLRAASPMQATDLLEGKLQLAAIPDLQRDIMRMLTHSQGKAFTFDSRASLEIGAAS